MKKRLFSSTRPTRDHLKRIRRGILWATPGQLDAGLSSLATFAVGVVAVRELGSSTLGAYSLLFSAFYVVNQFSSELIFSPSQVIAIDLSTNQRLGMLANSIPKGAVLTVVSALAVPLGVLSVAADIPAPDLVPLITTVALLALVSPIQDHVRAMLHLSEASWMAAIMSGTHLVGTIVTLAILSGFSPTGAPFGSLFVGNCISLTVGGLWIHRRKVPASPRPTLRQLLSIGGWLLASDFVKTLLRYAASALLAALAGVAALGFVEGARVVSQPINVLALGLMSQVGPHLTKAGATRNAKEARRWNSRFVGLLCAAAVPYSVITAWSWSFNPLTDLMPLAYAIPGMTAATLVVVLISCFLRAQRAQLLGARLQRMVARVTVTTGFLEVLVFALAGLIGAYAAPLGTGAATLIGLLWLSRIIRRVYGIGLVRQTWDRV